MTWDEVYVKGRGKIPFVDHQPDNRNACGGCGSTNLQLENHSAMWGDGDVICLDCGGYVRMWNSG